jgi:hypothetical protein
MRTKPEKQSFRSFLQSVDPDQLAKDFSQAIRERPAESQIISPEMQKVFAAMPPYKPKQKGK